jgi:lipid-A-disaccharide synthase
MLKKKICILAGERSGDNYASLLCKELKRLKEDIFIFGVGGKQMEKCGVDLIGNFPFGQMGFSGVLKKIFTYIKFLKKVVGKIKEEKPDIVIFIDNPGFNLCVAKNLKRRFKTVYYIPPKIWAHNYKRIEIIRKYVDFVIPIFPFEVEIYKKEKIPHCYFGHPFVDLIKKDTHFKKVKNGNIKIGILPGSRKEEIEYNLPLIKKIVEILKEKIEFDVLISCAEEDFRKYIERVFRNFYKFEIMDDLYLLIENCDLIFAVSGTVNLEVAYFEKPMIVFYKTSFLNYLFAKLMVKLNMISPVNIIVGEKLIPEYIQFFKVKKVIEDAVELIEKKGLYEKEMKCFKKMKELIKERNVSRNVANFIIENVERIYKD